MVAEFALQPEDVTSLLSIKLALRYAQLREVESMRAVARAHQNRNLAEFEKALRDYRDELSSDPTIRSHLAALYDTLLEQNLLRIVEPYAIVEVEYVAQQVGQGRQAVELKYVTLPRACDGAYACGRRLSQMILDKVFHGVLDQGRGCLLIFEQPEADVRARPFRRFRPLYPTNGTTYRGHTAQRSTRLSKSERS